MVYKGYEIRECVVLDVETFEIYLDNKYIDTALDSEQARTKINKLAIGWMASTNSFKKMVVDEYQTKKALLKKLQANGITSPYLEKSELILKTQTTLLKYLINKDHAIGSGWDKNINQ